MQTGIRFTMTNRKVSILFYDFFGSDGMSYIFFLYDLFEKHNAHFTCSDVTLHDLGLRKANSPTRNNSRSWVNGVNGLNVVRIKQSYPYFFSMRILGRAVKVRRFISECITKQGPAGQRCVYGHIKHMKHTYEAHVWSTWSTYRQSTWPINDISGQSIMIFMWKML